MEYIVGAVALLAALCFVAYPLFRRSPVAPAQPAEPSFSVQRADVYRELLELEFDHRVGKLNDADFRQLTDACIARASALVAAEERTTKALNARIEREVAAMRAALRSHAKSGEEVRSS